MNDIAEHQRSFDKIYGKFTKMNLEEIDFPLEQIQNLNWSSVQKPLYPYYYRLFTNHIFQLLRLKDNMDLLHLGCGFGFEEKNINRLYRGVNQFSIDISREMIVACVIAKSPSRFATAPAESLPFPDNSFDRIISREVIEHVMDPAVMVKEISRCLKPGGRAVVTTLFEDSFTGFHLYHEKFLGIFRKILNYPKIEEYKDSAPSVSEMKKFSNAAGLQIETIKWDGALYSLLKGNPLLDNSSFPKISLFLVRLFSIFEGEGTFARYFCDQIKFVLVKPENNSLKIEKPTFRCLCEKHGSIIKANGNFQCTECNKNFPALMDNAIDLMFSDESLNQENRPVEPLKTNKLKRVVFRFLELLGVFYSLIYFIASFIIALPLYFMTALGLRKKTDWS